MLVIFFFFKQKTSYELRISDWSSDVCSSDLIGYDFGAFRAEAEVGYRRATIDHFSLDGVRAGTKSNNSALSFMLNGLLDFGPDDGLQGFVGGGAGVARVRQNTENVVYDTDRKSTRLNSSH